MTQPIIGVDVDDLRLSLKDGIRTAAEQQFGAVEVSATSTEVDPRHLSVSGRRHFSRYITGHGLQLASLTADFPQLRITDPRTVQERIERTRAIFDLARDVDSPVVTTSVGALTHPELGEPSPLAIEALSQLAEYAESRRIVLAIRPSHDSAERMQAVFKAIGSRALRIGLDPAASVMAGANPLSLLMRFPDQLALIHLRDGTAGAVDRGGRETQLGEGDVDMRAILEVLRETDFSGAHIIRRMDSANPLQDCLRARDLAASWLK